MTYDMAVWKQAGPISDEAATEEFQRRCEQADARFDEGLREPPCPELAELLVRLRAAFPGDLPPWDGPEDGDLRGEADGEFIYITMTYSEDPAVVDFLGRAAAVLGLIVYDPQLGSVVT
jgi:hypothetical protein